MNRKGLITNWVLRATKIVYPSGAALATAPVPISPDAPDRLSTITFWPSFLPIFSAISRAVASVPPPGG